VGWRLGSNEIIRWSLVLVWFIESNIKQLKVDDESLDGYFPSRLTLSVLRHGTRDFCPSQDA
jgi:hypothetical protein